MAFGMSTPDGAPTEHASTPNVSIANANGFFIGARVNSTDLLGVGDIQVIMSKRAGPGTAVNQYTWELSLQDDGKFNIGFFETGATGFGGAQSGVVTTDQTVVDGDDFWFGVSVRFVPGGRAQWYWGGTGATPTWVTWGAETSEQAGVLDVRAGTDNIVVGDGRYASGPEDEWVGTIYEAFFEDKPFGTGTVTHYFNAADFELGDGNTDTAVGSAGNTWTLAGSAAMITDDATPSFPVVPGISGITFSSDTTATFVVTLPPGYRSGDHVVIVIDNHGTSKPDEPSDFDTDYDLISGLSKSALFLRTYDRTMDGTEGATVTIDMDQNVLHKAWAFKLTAVEKASQGTVGTYTENKPRINLPVTMDSGDTANKLWLMVGGNQGSSTHTPLSPNVDSWAHDVTAAGTPSLAYGWKLSTVQSFVGSGAFPQWDHTSGFLALCAMAIFWDVSVGTAVSTGTLGTEAGVIAGGQTIILTLTGETWVATVGADNAITTALIDGIDAAQVELGGFDAIVQPLITFAEVVRTSDTVVTITLPAAAAYLVTADELVTATIPASAVALGAEIVATSPLTITDDPLLPVVVAAGGGASAADLGQRPGRSGAARRRIVDLNDPRRKYRLPY